MASGPGVLESEAVASVLCHGIGCVETCRWQDGGAGLAIAWWGQVPRAVPYAQGSELRLVDERELPASCRDGRAVDVSRGASRASFVRSFALGLHPGCILVPPTPRFNDRRRDDNGDRYFTAVADEARRTWLVARSRGALGRTRVLHW